MVRDLSAVHKAIIEAFDKDELERLLRFDLGYSLNSLSSEQSDWEKIAFDVVDKAARQNWLDELVDAMQTENPNSPIVRSLDSFGGEMGREYNGLSSQISGISQDIFRLRNVVLGDDEIGTEGILSRLKAIENKIESLGGEVRRIDTTLSALTATAGNPRADKAIKWIGTVVILVTVASLFVSLVQVLGGGLYGG